MKYEADCYLPGLYTENFLCPRATSVSGAQRSRRRALTWNAGDCFGCPVSSLLHCGTWLGWVPGLFLCCWPQQLPLTHFLPKAGFGLPSNASRPSLPVMCYVFGMELHSNCVWPVCSTRLAFAEIQTLKLFLRSFSRKKLYIILLQYILYWFPKWVWKYPT